MGTSKGLETEEVGVRIINFQGKFREEYVGANVKCRVGAAAMSAAMKAQGEERITKVRNVQSIPRLDDLAVQAVDSRTDAFDGDSGVVTKEDRLVGKATVGCEAFVVGKQVISGTISAQASSESEVLVVAILSWHRVRASEAVRLSWHERKRAEAWQACLRDRRLASFRFHFAPTRLAEGQPNGRE